MLMFEPLQMSRDAVFLWIRELHGFNFLKKESIIKSKIFHRFYKVDHLIATNGALNNIISYIFDLITPVVSYCNCFNCFILFL